MDGIFNVLKPPGMTSHDVIGFLRRALNTKKIGHGGTLDPDAAGVLPVFAGTATRLLSYAMEGRKQYIAEFTLGEQRDTGDDSGTLVKTMPVPELSEAKLKEVLQSFKKLWENNRMRLGMTMNCWISAPHIPVFHLFSLRKAETN